MSPQNSPPPAQDNPKSEAPFQTNIVTNIPIHSAGGTPAQAVPAAPPPRNAEDPDKIMRAVGDQLMKEDIQKPKHHFWNKTPDVSQQTKFSAHPVPRGSAQPMPEPAPPAAQDPSAQTPGLPQAAKPAIPPAPPKPKSSVPVLTILITLVVTGGLIALAVVSLS